MHLIMLLLVPVVVGALGLAFRRGITKKEFVLMEVVMAVLIAVGFKVGTWNSMRDVEHWNGRISAKLHGTMGCCHCREECDTCRDSKGQTTSCNCRRVCDHTHDYYWNLGVTTGDTLSARRCEPNSGNVPEVWTRAKIGEPAAVKHSYTNYLLADKQSLLRRGAPEQFMSAVPAFPGVYDLYRVNRVISLGVAVPDGWETGLRELNSDLGGAKQVDVTMIFTSVQDRVFAQAVETKWNYGPKNALIIVAGVKDGTVTWAEVVTISRVEDLKILIRDTLPGAKLAETETTLALLRQAIVKKFNRTPMSEFEYLASSAEPSTGWIIMLYLLAVIFSLVLAHVMDQKDVFGDEGYGRWKRY